MSRNERNLMIAMATLSQSFFWRLLFGSWTLFSLGMWFDVISPFLLSSPSPELGCWVMREDTDLMLLSFSFFFLTIFSPMFTCEELIFHDAVLAILSSSCWVQHPPPYFMILKCFKHWHLRQKLFNTSIILCNIFPSVLRWRILYLKCAEKATVQILIFSTGF